MKRALIVGIENYPGAPLRGCAADANAVCKMLARNEDNTRNFDAEIYTDDIKTHADLRKRIEALFASRNDVALFYFSGHGAVSRSGNSYLVTPDWDEHDKGMPVADLIQMASDSPAKTKIIILDCCHAGAAGKFISGKNANIIGEDTIILASSRENEYSKMVNGHSVFTNLLLEALNGGAADLSGKISPASVYAMIDQSLGALDQRPVFKAIVDKLITLRRVKPFIATEVMMEIVKLFEYADTVFELDKTYIKEEEAAIAAHVEKFQILQKYNRAGIVVPNGEQDMFWAGVNDKSCSLTPLGKHYWRLCKDGRF